MLKLWLMAGILAGLAIFTAGTWRMASSVRFSRESTVLRGTFLAYVENRVGGASDEKRFFRNSYPRFEFEMADGTRREVVGAENHLFRVFRGGDRVEVLVHPDGRERIRAFVPLYAHAVNLLLLGGLLFVMALGGLRSVQSWDRAVSGGDPAVQVPGPEARAPSGWSIGPVAFGILLLVAGGTVGVNLVLSRSRVAPPERTSPEGLDRAGGGPDPERLDRSNRGPEPATAEPDVDLSGPADGAEPPAPPSLHAAAREGDVEALASLLDAGRSVEDLEPAMVMHLVRRDDTGAIRVLLEHGLDPAGEYGGRTIGDHAVAAGSAEVVKLIQDHGGRFDAPPAFVALAAGDREALTAALPQADPSAQFTGSTLPWFARHIGREDLLRESAPDRALPPRQEPRGGHLSAAHAARAGDHAALREFIEDGADIADINP
ncbi:MAG: ankyrin repeat domain-containing protein, partial [Acidobacteriota bacterium]